MADTSIYNRQGAQQPNALQTYGQFLQFQGLQNQNQLFQQEFKDRAAMSEAYKAGFDPATGQMDYNKVQQNLLTGGMGRLIPQAIQGAQEQLNRQIGIDKAQLDLNVSRLNTMNGALTTLLNKPDLSKKDIIAKGGELISQGVATPQMVANFVANLPDDSGQMKSALQQTMIQTLQSQERLKAMTPQPQMVNLGGSQRVVDMNPLTNPGIAGQQFQNTMSPGEAAGQVRYFNPQTNREEIMSAAQFAQMMNGAPGSGPGSTPGAIGLPSGPALGAEGAADVAARGSATSGLALQNLASNVPQRKALLGQMDNVIEDFKSGPGAESWKQIVAGANRIFGVDSKSVASQEEFNKFATQLALSQFQSLGGTGTDTQLGSAIAANPNEALSNLGNKKIIQMLKGNEDAIAAKNADWQAWLASGKGPQTYGQFEAQFNKTFDPRAFQMAYMSPEDRNKMISGLNDQEKKSFAQALRVGLEKGWIRLPEAAQ